MVHYIILTIGYLSAGLFWAAFYHPVHCVLATAALAVFALVSSDV